MGVVVCVWILGLLRLVTLGFWLWCGVRSVRSKDLEIGGRK